VGRGVEIREKEWLNIVLKREKKQRLKKNLQKKNRRINKIIYERNYSIKDEDLNLK